MRTNPMLGALVLGLLCLQCTFYTRRPGDNAANGGNGDMNNPGGGGGSNQMSGPIGDALPGMWADATGNLVDVKSGFGDLTYVSAKPDEDKLIAGISEAGLWVSTDGAASWSVLGDGAGSDAIDNRPNAIVYDPDHSDTFWVAGPYGKGVFRTDDNGATFKQLGTVKDIDLVAIDFTDPDRQTMMGSVHESRTIYRSTDGGDHWDDITASIPSTVNNCGFPLVLDAQTHFLGCSEFGGQMGGVVKTTDGGSTWALVTDLPGDSTPLLASDGSIYWSIQLNGGLMRSTDQGETWTSSQQSKTIHPIELPDGRIAVVNSDYLLLTADGGKTWHVASPKLPYTPAGVTYSSFQRAFYIWTLSATGMPPVGSVARFDFDYEKQ